MSMKVLVDDYPHRTVAIATDEYAMLFRHTHSANPSAISLPLPDGKTKTAAPRCMVEFALTSSLDLAHHRNVAAARGCLGLITLNQDVFLCVVTGSVEAATPRPGESVQRIYAVEFYCINRSDYDHSHGHPGSHIPNPYPGQTFSSDEFDYGGGAGGGGFDSGSELAEHPFHALQKLLSGGNFYYSVDFDLTRRLQDRADSDISVDISRLDEGLLWNSYMINPLIQFRSRLTHLEKHALDQSGMLTSVIRGFARTLAVPPSSSPIRRKVINMPSSLTVISRLSSRRAGTRFNSRGIDDSGNVANFVETETIFWSSSGLCFSYTQVRGSVPIFWESSSSLIPGQQKIHITRSPEATQPSFDKHFDNLEKTYGAVHVINLLSAARPAEAELSQRYRQHIQRSPLRRQDPGQEEDHSLLRATEFDFNEHTRGGSGYDGARLMRPYIDGSAEAFVYFLSEEIEEWTAEKGKPKKLKRPAVIMQQNGVFRVNCLDCLDRTNLVQGMLSRLAIEAFLDHRGEQSNSDFWMRHSTLWADNGDALSKIYAGTGALKSSFTRHGKMSLAGALADARKSATRLYVNHFEDKGRQNVIDLLLGRLYGQDSVDLFDPINDWVVAELSRRRTEFESRAQIKVLVGSYNLNGKTHGVKEDLSPWLNVSGGIDVVVVGFQEIVELSPQQIMSTDPNRRMVWEHAVRNCLNGYPDEKSEATTGVDDYVLLRSGQLVGAALLIFVRSSLLSRITSVEGAIKKTGMSGIAGNKGAVAIRMEIDSTSVCFVTAHLAAGFGNYDERNRDYNTITSGLRFARDRSVEDHEIVVWAGDFNYRIGLSYEKARALAQDVQLGGARAEDALGKLYENDQLNIQMVQGNCFQFYREGRVVFLPTYKYDLGKDEFDSSDKARIPAWTDRILFKVNQKNLGVGEELGTKLRQVEYGSAMGMRFSDHRPVYSIFEMGVRVVDEAKKDLLTRKLYRKRAKEVKPKIEEGGSGSELDEESDIEETMGYQSISEGLPPASSDRRKWWLDGDKGASSRLAAPGPKMKLNPNRSGNPWRSTDGAEDVDDWVHVERPREGSDAPTLKSTQTQVSRSEKPQPPPARGSGRGRMIPPPWEGERMSSQTTIATVRSFNSPASIDGSVTPPAPPPSRGTAATVERGRTPSISSINSVSKKAPPPKPVKPSSLTTTTSTISPAPTGMPTASPVHTVSTAPPILADRPHASVSTMGISMVDNDYNDDEPPPLPRRVNTTSTTASMVSASSQPQTQASENNGEGMEMGLRKVPPPFVQPRRVSRLVSEASPQPLSTPNSDGRTRDASISSVHSTHSNHSSHNARSHESEKANRTEGMERAPALPPRRPTDLGLMDRDDEGANGEMGGLGGWEVMKPS